MTGLFYKLVEMSLSATWLVLAVIAVRLMLKKAPRWLICGLWGLVALRLLCPFTLESPFSLIPDVEIPPAVSQNAEAPAENRAYGEILSSDGEVLVTKPLQPTEGMAYGEILSSDGEVLVTKPLQPINAQSNSPSYLPHIWVLGMLIMAIYASVSYLRIRKRVQVSIELGNGVYLCDYIATPFILGILRPKIYLPSEMAPADAAYVLAHEKAHLKRRDHWWKPLGYLLLTVYWFNPLLWIAYLLLCRDIELACDEKVIKTMDGPEKKAYSEALLKCSVPRHMIAACPLAFGEVSVKQRIRSVLNYRKPSFWIILISLILIALVAVCFLTEPESPTLANILEIPEDELDGIYLWGKKGRVSFETKEEISECLKLLDSFAYDPIPAAASPILEMSDEHDWSYETVVFQYGRKEARILMDYDYSLVWTMDADGNVSLPYPLKDSTAFQSYLHDHVTTVVNREVSAEAFARQDQPAQWLHGIYMNALRTAKYYDSTNNFLTNAQTSKLLEILNSIPESAISEVHHMEDFSFGEKSPTSPAIILTDDANGLTGIFHYFAGSMELAIMQTSDYEVDPWMNPHGPATVCTVESQKLRSLFEEWMQNPPDVLVFMGAKYNIQREKEVLSDGEATVNALILSDWDYVFTRPEDGEDFFGFLCRPKTEPEGWISFYWWRDGFLPQAGEQEAVTNQYGYHYTYTSTGYLPNDSYMRAHCSHGDFVISYEKIDTWTKKHQEDASWIGSFVDVTCELQHRHTEIPETLVDNLENVAYYDWDSVARQLGTENLVLFDVEYSGEYMFVGLSHDGAYHIACFRQIEAYDYAFVQLLEPVVKDLPSTEKRTAPIAEFEDGDSRLHIYIMEDEAITGIECNNGFESYLQWNSTPALVILDESLWGTEAISFDLRSDAVPELYFIVPQNGSYFEFSQSPQYYLYSCLVEYKNDKHTLESYSMNTEELWDLSEYLLSLHEGEQILVPIDDAPDFDVTNDPEDSASTYLDLRFSNISRYMWSQYGIQTEEPGSMQVELYYCDGTVTLGVNMRVLDKNVYRDYYYFEINSPEMADYFQSLCNGHRKTS